MRKTAGPVADQPRRPRSTHPPEGPLPLRATGRPDRRHPPLSNKKNEPWKGFAPSRGLGKEACSRDELLTPASFRFFRRR